jgi:hypothetical protein
MMRLNLLQQKLKSSYGSIMYQMRRSYLAKTPQTKKASNEKPITHFQLATKASVQPEFHGLAYSYHETLAVTGCAS